jgi:fibronectin type 3 domain-containing protein
VAAAVAVAGTLSCGSDDANAPEIGGAIPQAVRAAIEESNVNLTWDPVEDALGYRVYMAEVGGVTRINVGELAGNMTHNHSNAVFDHPPGLEPGKKYYFVVTAVHAGNRESQESCEVTARITAGEGSAC